MLKDHHVIQTVKATPGGAPDTEGIREEILAFARGGLPGIVRLKKVLGNVFEHFGLHDVDEQVRLLKDMGLRGCVQEEENGGKRATFLIPEGALEGKCDVYGNDL